MLQYAILGFLQYRPFSGYDLKKLIDNSIQFFWHAKQSQIYKTLKELEQHGFVSATVKEQSEKPDKRIYRITDKGKNDLLNWLNQEEATVAQKKDPFLLKLFFSAPLHKEQILFNLKLNLKKHQALIEDFKNNIKHNMQSYAEKSESLRRDSFFWKATYDFGEMYYTAYVKWLHQLIEKVEQEL
jgi:PadR family transcriptional regulator AphA